MKKRLAGGGSVLSGSDFEDGRQLRTETACTTSACYPARYETRRACSTAANRYGSYNGAAAAQAKSMSIEHAVLQKRERIILKSGSKGRGGRDTILSAVRY